MSVNAFAVVLLSMTAALSCRPRATSTVKHVLGEPVRSTDAWQWVDLTSAEYTTIVAPAYGISRDDIIAEKDHKLFERANYIVSQIDQNLRKAYPQDLKNVPKPKAMIVKDPEANAFVSSAAVCLDLGVRLNTNNPARESSTIEVIEINSSGLSIAESPQNPCISSKHDSTQINNIIAWFNQSYHECTLKLGSEGGKPLLIADQNCLMDPMIKTASYAKTARISVTNNWITINTGLFAKFPDKEWMVIPTIAHEMGHYYRAHLTASDSEYGFFYMLSHASPDSKPKPEAGLSDRGIKVSQSQRLLDMPDRLRGQTLHPGVYLFANSVIRSMCARGNIDCAKDCAYIDKRILNSYWQDNLGDYPDDSIPDQNKNVLLDYEARLLTCARSINITSTIQTRGIAQAEIEKSISDFSSIIQPPKKTIFMDALNDLNGQLNKAKATAERAVAEAEDDGLARYTIETEADEFGLEQFIGLGFTAHDWIESDFIFNEDDNLDADEKNAFKECLSAFKNGWKTPDGRPFIPARGGFFEAHPNACYRSYNMSLESSSHQYPTADRPVNISLLKDSDWRYVAKNAKALKKTFAGSDTGSQGQYAKSSRNPMRNCYYRKKPTYQGRR